jgi:hypothetical protein
MPPAGFEPAIPASERPQAYALDRAGTGTDDYTNAQAKDKATLAFQNTWYFSYANTVSLAERV